VISKAEDQRCIFLQELLSQSQTHIMHQGNQDLHIVPTPKAAFLPAKEL